MMKSCSVMVAVVISHVAFAQKSTTRAIARPPDDVLAIKQKAEAGNVPAQVALGDKLAASLRHVDALVWYRKASEKGSVEAYYRMGDMLLHESLRPALDQRVAANPIEGIHWTFRAATNLHTLACRNMSRSLQTGLGVKTNFVEAYAWLHLFAERDPSAGRSELDSLALRMETRDLQEGQKLARQFKGRQWPKLVLVSTTKTPTPLAAITLEGITFGGRIPLAVINRRTLAAGESAQVSVKGSTIEVRCLEISENSVRIEVEGEDEPRWLRFDGNLVVRGP